MSKSESAAERKLVPLPPEMVAGAQAFMQARSVPFWGHHDVHSLGEPRQYGTGVLLQVGDTRLILTAAHVTEMFLKHGCSVFVGAGGTDRLMPLDGARVRYLANADVAVIVPTELSWSKFPPEKRFTHLSEVVSADPTAEAGGLYCAFGYPSTESSVDHDAKQLSMVGQSCLGFPFANATQSFDASKHVAIQFDRSRHPDPGGMSGGGIWRIVQAGVPGKWSAEDIRLVAIEHTWGNDGRALLGTRMDYVLELIRQVDPTLGPAISLIWPTKPRTTPSRWVVDG